MDIQSLVGPNSRFPSLGYYDDKLVARPGSSIDRACEELVALARATNQSFSIDFNGITVFANPQSDATKLHQEWRAGMDRRAAAYRASPEHAARQAAAKKAADQKAKLEWALSQAKDTIEVKDQAVYDDWKAKNTDGMGKAIFEYAETWARLMEVGLARGNTLKEIAQNTSSLADNMGLSGSMFWMAVSVLEQCWVHGDGLRAAVK